MRLPEYLNSGAAFNWSAEAFIGSFVPHPDMRLGKLIPLSKRRFERADNYKTGTDSKTVCT
jgi:hypothetical protein